MNEKKHISYSAADIERYHKGLMTAKEMNALEKAALDDPFLADAIEGYSIVTTEAENDVLLLTKKLDERINDNKVVPLRKASYTWLRVAAAIIVIGGAGILAYKSIFQYKKRDVAATEQKEAANKQDTLQDTAEKKRTDTIYKPTEADRKEEEAGYTAIKKDKATKIENVATEEKAVIKNEEIQPAGAPAREAINDVAINKDEALNKADTIKQLSAEQSSSSNGYARAKPGDDAAKAKKEMTQDKNKSLNEVTVAKGTTTQNIKTNYFRGQVVDANNTPLPFANVTIVPDNIGTYTDVKGNFVLISPDSVLDVKVHSVGFENNN
ncbi:MAG: carboxypeptidase-like regulatory domain-containing protein, partial [Bacteroidetes bacterium]|nr:carboxypeptidase-like regulatory domain-containing protein [Bacteroidota bacterium]